MRSVPALTATSTRTAAERRCWGDHRRCAGRGRRCRQRSPGRRGRIGRRGACLSPRCSGRPGRGMAKRNRLRRNGFTAASLRGRRRYRCRTPSHRRRIGLAAHGPDRVAGGCVSRRRTECTAATGRRQRLAGRYPGNRLGGCGAHGAWSCTRPYVRSVGGAAVGHAVGGATCCRCSAHRRAGGAGLATRRLNLGAARSRRRTCRSGRPDRPDTGLLLGQSCRTGRFPARESRRPRRRASRAP